MEKNVAMLQYFALSLSHKLFVDTSDSRSKYLTYI